MMPQATFVDVLARHAQQTPGRPALRDPAGTVTWAQTWQATVSAAAWLRGAGVRAGDRVGIALPGSAASLILMFGAMAAGAIAAPLNTRMTRRELTEYLGGIEPRLVIASDDYRELIDDQICGSVRLLTPTPRSAQDPLAILDSVSAPASPLPDPDVDPAAAAIMFGTGGTTGTPKAAVWSHERLWLYAASCSAAMEVRCTDTELFFSPIFHIALVTGPFGTLFSGGAVHVLPDSDPAAVAAVLASGTITRLFGAPTALMRIIERPGFDPAAMGGMRRVLFGSTRSEPDLATRLAAAFPHAELVTGYGATEFGAVVRLRSWEMEAGQDQGVGKAVPGVSVLIVGPGDAILPPGQIGELVIRAPWQMLGYWCPRADEGTAFVHGGVRSGDLGERDADGCIHLRGRLKDVVITGGENVFPAEVEDVLSGHPGVAEVAVVGVLDREWGERVEAVIVAAPAGEAATAAELTAWCRDRLARYKVPKRFHFVTEMPLTTAMKVDKRSLREQLANA
jgi:fatty-acyl-CoA synthase